MVMFLVFKPNAFQTAMLSSYSTKIAKFFLLRKYFQCVSA